jgi:hypothetical protein
MTADVPSNAQQSGIEIASTFGAASFGAMVTGVTGAVGAGILIKGWVFFICTEPETLGGSGRTVMRAVSFFGPGETNSVSAAGMPAAKGAEGANDGRGAEVADDDEIGGGKNVGGETGPGGADGCEMGGRGELGGVGGGATGAGRFGSIPLAGGRAGRLIRTVSRLAAAASVGLGVTRGGNVIRTVSFFGSFGSGIGPPKWRNKVPKNQKFVTR